MSSSKKQAVKKRWSNAH